jgi:hypothetical protein
VTRLLISGISPGVGGLNSTRAYFHSVCNFGRLNNTVPIKKKEILRKTKRKTRQTQMKKTPYDSTKREF